MQNYFELFEMPKAFFIDTQFLRKKFYSLSREQHPDNLQNEDQNKNENDSKINEINLAYKILLDPLQRLKHILEIEGVSSVLEKPLEPSFLMEMIELHEEIHLAVQACDQEKINTLQKQLNDYEQILEVSKKSSISTYDSGQFDTKTLESLVDYFIKLRYIRRLKKALLNEDEM
ncbi:MAG: Fe-S protein assembly co-chaperone HscB [Saprospiraceae bacterium]|nr:Fe-S protein assembly co-chaperone HscB [Saprospiraceae bacterium]